MNNKPMNNKPINNKPMNNASMKMKLLILLCFAALPAMSSRAADNTENPAAKPGSVESIASDRDPFWDDKSPECQFLAGAWEGYVAGLTASADKDSDYKTTLARWFHLMQRGVYANVFAYENLKRECSDTDEHKALFLQVEKVARLVDNAFVKRFSKPTKLAHYEKWLGMELDDNVENPAAKRGNVENPDADLSSAERGITYRLEVESVITEETSLTVKAGEYKMGEPLDLGVFEGEPVTLLVK